MRGRYDKHILRQVYDGKESTMIVAAVKASRASHGYENHWNITRAMIAATPMRTRVATEKIRDKNVRTQVSFERLGAVRGSSGDGSTSVERNGVASSVEYRAVDDGKKAVGSLVGASVGDIGRGVIYESDIERVKEYMF